MLTYMPREKVRHEFVTVTPDGYRFRRQNFETLSQLMKWFKVSLLYILSHYLDIRKTIRIEKYKIHGNSVA